jgi:hypothetical protein
LNESHCVWATLKESRILRRSRFPTLSRVVFVFCFSLFATPSLAIDQVVIVNPDMKNRITGRSYQGRDLSYRMRVPDLGLKVFVEDKDVSKGITAWTQFLSPEIGALYVVSTKIRDDLPKDDSILPRVAARYQRFVSAYPTAFAQRYSQAKYGRVFEFTLINARGDGLYPLQVGYQPARLPETFALHRFFVASGYLFEFALLMHTNGAVKGLSVEELNGKATQIVNDAVDGFVPAPQEPPNSRLRPTRASARG